MSTIIPVLALAVLTLVLTFLSPRRASALVWLVLFILPHSWWYRYRLLPLNTGLDDLFCVLFFLVILFRRHILDGIRIRIGYAFWTVIGFALAATIANCSGMSDRPLEWTLYLGDILKVWAYWSVFYAILHCIDEQEDLRCQLAGLCLAAAIGAVWILMEYAWPHWIAAWSDPSVLAAASSWGRSNGGLLDTDDRACVLACSIILTPFASALHRSILWKALLWSGSGLTVAGLLAARSRSGLIAVGIGIFLMLVFSRQKRLALALILGPIAIVAGLAWLARTIQQQVGMVYEPISWASDLAGLLWVWNSYLHTNTIWTYILGQGPRAGIANNGTQTYSAYISILTVYGLPGVVWAIGAIIGLIKTIRSNQDEDTYTCILRRCCLWVFIVWALYATSSDALSSQYPRYLLFYLITMADRVNAIARQMASSIAYWDRFIEEGLGRFEKVADLEIRLPRPLSKRRSRPKS